MGPIVRLLSLAAFLILSGTNVFALDKPDKPGSTIDPEKTAVLVMDYQNDILGMLPKGLRDSLVERANAILDKARQAKIQVIYVAVRFREGYPEINPRNKMFGGLRKTGLLVEGKPGAEIDARLAPRPGDVVVTKRRVGAFSATDLETVLRSKNIDRLVMFGISTSGVVLSTVRWAADMDYAMTVVSDACADFDPEVNRVLLEKVFPPQATVVKSDELLRAIEADLSK